PKAASLTADQLLKEAGIVDSLLNFVTRRGRGLAAWEKKYPKEIKALRDGGSKLLDHADALLANSISVLKEMATARATRRPDEYMDLAAKIKAEFNKFDTAFKAYYAGAITPWMKIKDEIDAANKTRESAVAPTTPSDKTELGASPPSVVPSGSTGLPVTNVLPMGSGFVNPFTRPVPPGASPPFAPPAQDEKAPDTLRDPSVVPQPETKVRVAPEEPKN
ncbi:MAG: hypothetical protein HC877_24305, partial [Thioploca sp.]|nr:hypothetical protein [Thioploca sp.]